MLSEAHKNARRTKIGERFLGKCKAPVLSLRTKLAKALYSPILLTDERSPTRCDETRAHAMALLESTFN